MIARKGKERLQMYIQETSHGVQCARIQSRHVSTNDGSGDKRESLKPIVVCRLGSLISAVNFFWYVLLQRLEMSTWVCTIRMSIVCVFEDGGPIHMRS